LPRVVNSTTFTLASLIVRSRAGVEVEMVEPFLQAEVAQVVGAEFVAQVAGEILVLFEKGFLQ
jgi:hypothetical protein